MLTVNILVSIIIINVSVYDIAHGAAKCVVKDGFDSYELEGTWHYIAGIDPERVEVRCFNLTFKRMTKHIFNGSVNGYINGELRISTLNTYVRDGMLSVRYSQNRTSHEEFLMKMKTCNSINEFSLENPRHGYYFLFSKNYSVTPVFLKYYRVLGKSINSKLRLANNTVC